jgi:hypothetical protein
MTRPMVRGISQQNSDLDIMVQDTHYNIDLQFGFGIILEISGNGIPQLALLRQMERL